VPGVVVDEVERDHAGEQEEVTAAVRQSGEVASAAGGEVGEAVGGSSIGAVVGDVAGVAGAEVVGVVDDALQQPVQRGDPRLVGVGGRAGVAVLGRRVRGGGGERVDGERRAGAGGQLEPLQPRLAAALAPGPGAQLVVAGERGVVAALRFAGADRERSHARRDHGDRREAGEVRAAGRDERVEVAAVVAAGMQVVEAADRDAAIDRGGERRVESAVVRERGVGLAEPVEVVVEDLEGDAGACDAEAAAAGGEDGEGRCAFGAGALVVELGAGEAPQVGVWDLLGERLPSLQLASGRGEDPQPVDGDRPRQREQGAPGGGGGRIGHPAILWHAAGGANRPSSGYCWKRSRGGTRAARTPGIATIASVSARTSATRPIV